MKVEFSAVLFATLSKQSAHQKGQALFDAEAEETDEKQRDPIKV